MIRNLRSGVSTSATKTASVWAWVRLHPANSASSNLQSHALSKKILRGCLKFLPKEYASDRKKTHSRINRARARGSTDDRLLKERPIVFFRGGTSPFSLTGVVKSAFTWANFWLKGLLIFQQNFAWMSADFLNLCFNQMAFLQRDCREACNQISQQIGRQGWKIVVREV